MRGPDCLTDPYVVKFTLKITFKPLYRRQKSYHKWMLHTTQLKDRTYQEHIQQEINRPLQDMPDLESPQQFWEYFSKGVSDAAVEAFSHTRKSNANWFNENDPKIRQALEERNQALKTKLSNPTEVN